MNSKIVTAQFINMDTGEIIADCKPTRHFTDSKLSVDARVSQIYLSFLRGLKEGINLQLVLSVTDDYDVNRVTQQNLF